MTGAADKKMIGASKMLPASEREKEKRPYRRRGPGARGARNCDPGPFKGVKTAETRPSQKIQRIQRIVCARSAKGRES